MVLRRAFAVWLILLFVESIHGIFRRLVLEPWIGDFSARQISVFTGAALILMVSYLFIGWIRPGTAGQLTLIGVMWVVLTACVRDRNWTTRRLFMGAYLLGLQSCSRRSSRHWPSPDGLRSSNHG